MGLHSVLQTETMCRIKTFKSNRLNWFNIHNIQTCPFSTAAWCYMKKGYNIHPSFFLLRVLEGWSLFLERRERSNVTCKRTVVVESEKWKISLLLFCAITIVRSYWNIWLWVVNPSIHQHTIHTQTSLLDFIQLPIKMVESCRSCSWLQAMFIKFLILRKFYEMQKVKVTLL